jgi:hypothetical protein
MSSVEAQLAALWKDIDAVRSDVGDLRSEFRQRADGIERNIGDLVARSQQSHQELVKRIEDAESEQTQLNASALPLLGFGVVLTAAANPLSELRWFNGCPGAQPSGADSHRRALAEGA